MSFVCCCNCAREVVVVLCSSCRLHVAKTLCSTLTGHGVRLSLVAPSARIGNKERAPALDLLVKVSLVVCEERNFKGCLRPITLCVCVDGN
eukprot:6107722-Amphidinium_carterae.1